MPAYAIAITEENIRGVILSEAGPEFDIELALEWLEDHEAGWFLRDLGSPFDCEFFMPEVFVEMYGFLNDDRTSLIRSVVRM
jgi:hypothetical protein